LPLQAGSRELVTFSRECNATVPFSTQMSIAPSGRPFSPVQSPPFLVVLQGDVAGAWVSEDLVEVRASVDDAVRRRETSVGNVRIDYR
jgi:hypothetical protein